MALGDDEFSVKGLAKAGAEGGALGVLTGGVGEGLGFLAKGFISRGAATVLEAVAGPSEESAAPAAKGTADLASKAQATIKGTNARGQVTSRASFRTAVTQQAWDTASPGPTGGKLCPTCGKEVQVPPFSGNPLDWDRSHNPSWTNREFPWNVQRPAVRDNYNEGVSLECPSCNRSAGNDDSRFGVP